MGSSGSKDVSSVAGDIKQEIKQASDKNEHHDQNKDNQGAKNATAVIPVSPDASGNLHNPVGNNVTLGDAKAGTKKVFNSV